MRVALILSFSLLTRLPTPRVTDPTPAQIGASALFFPVVGLVLGLVLVLACHLLPQDPLLKAALLVTLWVWLTGGLHLDGLADTADAWIGGMGDRQRMLAIMKDPACGPAGVTSLVLVLLLKWAGLATWLLHHQDPWPLLLAPLAGRWSMLVLILTTPYARSQGMGSGLWHYLPRQTAWILILLWGLAFQGLAATLSCWLMGAALLALLGLGRHALLRRLAGSTGDTTGAFCEIIETAAVLMLASC